MRTEKSTSNRRRAGATLVEYAILLALIATICVAAVTAVGTKVSSVYDKSNQKLILDGSGGGSGGNGNGNGKP